MNVIIYSNLHIIISLILQLTLNDALAKKYMGRTSRAISKHEMRDATKEAVGVDACRGREKAFVKAGFQMWKKFQQEERKYVSISRVS